MTLSQLNQLYIDLDSIKNRLVYNFDKFTDFAIVEDQDYSMLVKDNITIFLKIENDKIVEWEVLINLVDIYKLK